MKWGMNMWPARIVALICLLLAALIGSAAFAQFNKCGRGICPGGITAPGFRTPGGGVAPLSNLRITDTGDFRITNVPDNRAVSP